ncbi:MAG: transglutaminase-like domain-containing protein [Bacteroidetes bacterium]|nr:transglutaminase-like domain-containing protein [Bacteroidota bacterium]
MLKHFALSLFLLFSLLSIFSGCSASYNRSQYIGILKSYPPYNNVDTSDIPVFYYSASSDSNLIRLRNKFNLDKIAGNGTEISKIINLMEWVHNSFRDDGSSQNPNPRNTFNIFKVCQEENRGINCRMYATVLNEVYLSMGFKSRLVTCMPAKVNFNDCHVINIVYSNTYKKWIYMDPTWDVYFTDENGNYLNIQEVRNRLMNNKILHVSNEININLDNYFYRLLNIFGESTTNYYLDYMSKNLFRFSCPTRSEFNEETNKDRSYIELVPKGYMVNKTTKVDSLKGYNLTTYFISSSKLFWETPKL